MSIARRCPVAFVARRIGQVEQCVQALLALERVRREELHRYVATDPDWQEVLFDSTVVRAHAGAAGAKKAAPRPKPWAARGAGSAPRSMP